MTALTVASCQKDIVDDIVAGDIDPLEGVNLAYEKQMIEEAEDRFAAAQASYSGKSASKTSGFESFSRIQNEGDVKGKKTTRYDIQVWLNGFGLHYGSNPNNPTAKIDDSWRTSKAYLFYHEDIEGVNHRFAGIDMGPDKSAFVFSSKDGAVKPKTWTFYEDNLDMVYYDLPLAQAFDEYVAIQGIVSGALGELHGCDLAYETEIGYETEYIIVDSDEGEITIDANLQAFDMTGMIVDIDPENWDGLSVKVTDSYNKPGSARTTLEYSIYTGTTDQLNTALNDEYIIAFIRCDDKRAGIEGYIVHDASDIRLTLAGEHEDLTGKYIVNAINKKPFFIKGYQIKDIDDPRFAYDKVTELAVDATHGEHIEAVFDLGSEVEVVDEASSPLAADRDDYIVVRLSRKSGSAFYDIIFVESNDDNSLLTRDSPSHDLTEVFGSAQWWTKLNHHLSFDQKGGYILVNDYVKIIDFGDDEVATANGDYDVGLKITGVEVQDGRTAISLKGSPSNYNTATVLIIPQERFAEDAYGEWSEWSPAFADQSAAFEQTRSREVFLDDGTDAASGIETRTITFGYSTYGNTIESTEAAEDIDVNGDGDKLDSIKNVQTIQITTPSHGYPKSEKVTYETGWTITQDVVDPNAPCTAAFENLDELVADIKVSPGNYGYSTIATCEGNYLVAISGGSSTEIGAGCDGTDSIATGETFEIFSGGTLVKTFYYVRGETGNLGDGAGTAQYNVNVFVDNPCDALIN